MKFSVILPLHNAEPFMRVMLESIRSQTFTDYELICICDSCDDKTADIAREYTDKVVEVSFGRAGLSRNMGLEMAQGEWVIFADDDDWLPDDGVYQWFADNAGRHGEDILYGSFDWIGMGLTKQTPERRYCAVWSKVWRREFIGNTRFSDRPYGDDADFDDAMLAKRPVMWFEDRCVYVYNYMRKGSLTDRVKKGEL